MRRPPLVALLLCAGLLVPLAPSAPAAEATAPPVVRRVVTTEASVARAATSERWRVKVRGWSKKVHRGRQATINDCKATLYWGALPGNQTTPAWLAAHDRCGFWRWDKWLPVGAKFRMISPSGQVIKYRVYGRDVIKRNSGPSDGLIHGDITLQTCRGAKMTFVYARRTG